MRIKVKHKTSGKVMYAINTYDSGYVTCIDYLGEILTYNGEKLKVIDPDYLPNKAESAKVSDSLPKIFLKI